MVEVNNLQNASQTNICYKNNETSNIEVKDTDSVTGNNKDKYSKEDLQKSVEKLNKFMDNEGTYAEISFHDKFKHDIMVKIIDKDTREVVMEIPPKKIIDMVAKMCEIAGVIFDRKV